MTPYSTTTAPADPAAGSAAARFLLLGDSHAGPIGRAAKAAGIPFSGGPVGAGREFNAEFFDVRENDVVFRKPETDALYRGFLGELGIDGLAGLAAPLVCTFGFSSHFVATTANWDIYRVPGGGFAPGFLDSRLFDGLVRATVRDALAFYGHARALGLRVVSAMPPQRVPGMSDPVVFMAAQDVTRRALLELGVDVVDLRARVTDGEGFQRPEFSEATDTIHGNLAFGRLILAELLALGL
ncbi:hypothetical protein ABT390_35060 [Streptomyces aurantiacus]|uniref:SGNH hydrolase-type esterase domain-containing protein n=1 Tax=Streptomyces aurantiacus JA 4570 TaxID=1286094 RepID=S3ZBQ0_9ACTN|nr:hypothetical protein [Streptomyces aurantiacus]EPH41111.1 hypothetical protein STRAU_5763 [Streptomyces aurantiacus JA 4570]